MHFVFYGPEGSGKGTQAKLLAGKFSLPLYTTGDLVREAAQKDKTYLGDMCRQVLKEGKYLPDLQVSKLIENKLISDEAKMGFVLDGFPRSIDQAKFLDDTIKKNGYKLDRFIYLSLSDAESIQRLAKRNRALFAGSNISHDDPRRVKNRLAVYREKEKNVLDFYKESNLILEINAAQSVDKVFADILSGLAIS